jgi:DNA-binding transcriptional ArsR family regulator/uncharacterized protein YndB with AHSA1/START domain
MDDVFRALDDPHRRRLLDGLFEADGRTLGELCDLVPGMTRQGVMNHLRVLEEAHLVSTVRDGRRKLHYLNPVPIRLVLDRWISKYAEPAVEALAALTTSLEGETPMPTPSHRYETYIRCTPEAAWNAIVDGDLTVQYFYGNRIDSTFEVGAEVPYFAPDGSKVSSGEVLVFDPPHRLEMTFLPMWDADLEAEGPAHTAWIVDEVNGLTRVAVEYYDLPSESKRAADFMSGIPFIVAGMKTLLETGEGLPQ